ncbi:MAG: IgGFc-binding protein [Deltaproteobacteria bacterium]|nr:IgGFc-binding protein [Deltaproteobacteria bacterium]MBW2546458.1 IgGFc-binding protein [Deltaproteobacteria bacterium]
MSIASCAGEASPGESGSLSVSLQLRGGIEIDQVTWEITRIGMAPMNGTINTSASGSTPSVEVFGLQPGEDYSITMAATSALGETSCGGSAEFDVESGVSTHVMVLLNCKPPQVLGGVRANGELNVCADLVVVVVVAQLQTSVGGEIELLAEAVDAEGDDIEYLWETTGGSFDDPTAADAIYTCEELGNYDISVAVSDDGFEYCTSGWTIRVTCEEGNGLECESDQDCGAGEVCADHVCVPDVECRFNLDCGADEICVDQVCVPDAECRFNADCGADEICVDQVCVPDAECHFDRDCGSGEICVDHVCVPDVECHFNLDCGAGEICVDHVCISDVECNVDQDCRSGEICVGNQCIPDVECNLDQDCGAGEICVGNVCVPDIECSVDQDCEDNNECTVTNCNVGSGQCNSTNVQNGTPCDNGDGVCTVGVCRTNDLLGTDFVIVFEANYLPPALTLFLSGPQTTVGTVSIPSTGFSELFLVTPGNVTKVALPPRSEITSNDVVELKAAVRVTSTEPITVYGFNRVPRGTDAFAALPTVALGQRYRVMAWTGGVNGPSQLAIAAIPASDGDMTTPTTVTITPAAAAGDRPAGVPYSIVLTPFDAYQLQSSGDLTGSLIQADRPIAVYAGNRCANIPTQMTGFCDHVVEQLTPVATWGTEVLTVPLATRVLGDTFRILADQNGTQVQLEGSSPESMTLNAGEFVERNLMGSYRISANAPILVAQFSNGSQWDNSTSDPFMMLIPSAAQFIKSYTFATPSTGFPTNFANVVALTTDVTAGMVLLDGTPLPAPMFTPLPGATRSAAQVPISVGTHTLSAPNPVGLYVYGYESFDSYGYPGGFTATTGTLP